jgi:hypothetical protein
MTPPLDLLKQKKQKGAVPLFFTNRRALDEPDGCNADAAG